METEDRHGLRSYKDRHGRTRWRYRHAGKTVHLPGKPNEPAFEVAYAAALRGEKPQAADIHKLPTAAHPRSFRAAWKIAKRDPSWLANTSETRARHEKIAVAFLDSAVVPGGAEKWGDQPIADLKRRHIKEILAERGDTPHAARHLLTRIRQMIVAALDEEWIEVDPSHKVKWRPAYKGWRAWTWDEMMAYEQRWPMGSTARLVYALALWQGHRRSDIAVLRPEEIEGDLLRLRQIKTDKELALPIVTMLRDVFDATDMSGPTILKTVYGNPFSAKSLTGKMAEWTKKADLPAGCTIHGLRKTLGKLMAEGNASTRSLMAALGHDDITHAELYSREAEQATLARRGIGAAAEVYEARRKGGEPPGEPRGEPSHNALKIKKIGAP